MKGAALPLPPILLRALLSLGHKLLASVRYPVLSFCFPKSWVTALILWGEEMFLSPGVVVFCCSLTSSHHGNAGGMQQVPSNFLSHHPTAFSLSALLVAGWERDRSTSWLPPPKTSFFPGLLPFGTHLASCGYRDEAEMLPQAPNLRVVETPAGSKTLELAEGSRDQGSPPKISQNQPTTRALTSPISCWCSWAPQLHWDWEFAGDAH